MADDDRKITTNRKTTEGDRLGHVVNQCKQNLTEAETIYEDAKRKLAKLKQTGSNTSSQ
jgi:hypothetical protein